MDMETAIQTISLALALWGAGLSSWLAYRGWLRNRTQIGLDIRRNFRLGNDTGYWEWLALEVSIRNGSDRPVSIVEYGLTIAHPDGTFTTAHPIHYGTLPNGDSIFFDPDSEARTAIRAQL